LFFAGIHTIKTITLESQSDGFEVFKECLFQVNQFHNRFIKRKERTLLISASGGRFPRARLQPPRRYTPAGSSARAVPAGVATFRYNQRE